ncbi:MAG: response regulator, partial [Bradyrhizobium sp.]|nr:response regulator [Bradyrhizobium sp.]
NLISQPAADKSLELSVDMDPRIPTHVQGDAMRLRQVLLNLLSNSVKFTETGTVQLRLQLDGIDSIRFSVSDTGIGIDTAHAEWLFARFTQADSSSTRRYGGTGLGLAISKGLIALMGGGLDVRSEPGRGSTFFFSLRMPSVEVPTPVISGPNSVSLQSYRILLAEDNATSRELIAAMLRQAGHDVVCVGDGRSAVETVANETFDLVLMDVQMPELDGRDAARAMRQLQSDAAEVPIIALTASAFTMEAERCLAAGMNAYVMKPIDWSTLFATMDRLAAGRAPERLNVSTTSASARPTNGDALDRAKFQLVREKVGTRSAERLLQLFEADIAGKFAFDCSSSDAIMVAESEAHAVAGAAGLLGFNDLAEACRDLKARVAAGERIHAALDRCRQARDLTLAELAALSMAAELIPDRADEDDAHDALAAS